MSNKTIYEERADDLRILAEKEPNADTPETDIIAQRDGLQERPVAWIRYCSDGSYEGPIVDSMMEALRKESGAWTPLFAKREEVARLRADARFREETTSTCWCETCRPITLYDMRMVLCPECGNKRCPRATNHIYQCTARKATK